MLRRSIICLLAVGATSALLNFTPPAAHAIPSAGDYVFTSGLAGTFTSDGTKLTDWHITVPAVPVMSTPFTDEMPASSVLHNRSDFFDQQVGTYSVDNVDYLQIFWEGTPSYWAYRTTPDGVGGGLRDGIPYSTVDLIAFEPASVPEPTALHLLGLGLSLLAFVGDVSRQRHHSELQVG